MTSNVLNDGSTASSSGGSSNNNNTDTGLSISPQECIAALDFMHHFNVPVPPSLYDAIERFMHEPTADTQNMLKLQLCKAIAESDHPLFKDPALEYLIASCRDEISGSLSS